MEMWELCIYRRWTHIPEWRYPHQYLWVSLANIVGSKSFLKKKKSKLNWTHSLTKLNTNKSCYLEKYLDLVGMCMSLRNISISFNSDESQNQGSARLTLLRYHTSQQFTHGYFLKFCLHEILCLPRHNHTNQFGL
jgi:hypothetical protein